jgi:transcriptional regulator with XRE-family HTH domain
LPFSTLQKTITKPYGSTYPKNPISIGEHIRKRRMEMRLTQEEVAKLIGVTTDSVTNWENNRSTPRLNLLPRVTKYLDIIPINLNPDTIGGMIKDYRLRKGLSQKDLGLLLRVNSSSISDWENNICLPNQQNLNKLQDLF